MYFYIYLSVEWSIHHLNNSLSISIYQLKFPVYYLLVHWFSIQLQNILNYFRYIFLNCIAFTLYAYIIVIYIDTINILLNILRICC